MLFIERTNQFKRDLKLAKRQGKNMILLEQIITQLEHEKSLDKKFRDHPLIGNWKSHRELHIEADWLLIYKIVSAEKTIFLARLGSHTELFK